MDSERICKNCRHWKCKEVRMFNEISKTFGKCKILSVAGFETLTAWDSTCEGDEDINSFEEKV